MNITEIQYRKLLPKYLNLNNLLGEGAEIGVKAGSYSDWLLKKWRGKKLYSIDMWKRYKMNSKGDVRIIADDSLKNEKKDRFYNITKDKLSIYKERSVILRMTSEDASKTINDNSLDFCYIDASHKYVQVKNDIKCWSPKIRKGGILCGHDYAPDIKKWALKWGDRKYPHGGVTQAVDEFAQEAKLKLHIDSVCFQESYSWYIKI